MKRPLYLDGGARPLAVRADGPSLRIEAAGRADGRAPLRLISRVVVRGRVAWQTEALVACMDADIPVAFVTADGTARGWCTGARGGGDDDLNRLLEELAMSPDALARQQDWVRAMERRALIAALPAGQPVPDDLRASAVWTAAEARLDRLRAPVATATILATLRGALDAHLVERFRAAGIDARFVLGIATPVRLVGDFARILAWTLWPAAERSALYFCRHDCGRKGDREIRRRLVRQYEAAAPLIGRGFDDLLWRLRRHLADRAA